MVWRGCRCRGSGCGGLSFIRHGVTKAAGPREWGGGRAVRARHLSKAGGDPVGQGVGPPTPNVLCSLWPWQSWTGHTQRGSSRLSCNPGAGRRTLDLGPTSLRGRWALRLSLGLSKGMESCLHSWHWNGTNLPWRAILRGD